MVANIDPIFGKTIQNSWQTMTTADTSLTAPSTAGALVATAGADGAMVFRLFAKPLGTNIQTVIRVFVNNGSTVATAANNSLLREWTIPASTAAANSALLDYEIPLNLKLKATYRIYVSVGTTIAAGLAVTAEWADY
ncbi:MAG: hypothetical protein JWQ44_2914 [Chthoniobacter sp.]|nr:hypothetical protein [Chthoniobacter sp.]